MIRGVLFDKDGTLLDYAQTWTPINRAVALLAARGDVQLADTLLRLGGQDPATGAMRPGSVLAVGTHEEIAALFESHLGDSAPEALADTIAATFETGGGLHSVLVDDAEATLDALAGAGIILGIATNDTAGGLTASLGRHTGFLDRFQFLAGCDSGYGAKPEPGMMLAFAATVDLQPREIAVVGDAVHDLEMARRAGAGLRIGVAGGTSPIHDLAPHAHHVLTRLGDLVGVIRQS